jgi:hypothetical protein
MDEEDQVRPYTGVNLLKVKVRLMDKTSRRRFLIAGTAVLAAPLLPPMTLMAHHGWGGYSDKDFELTGTVETPVSLAGPHATMRLKADGQVWDITLAPPARTQSAGLREGVIPVGAMVTVHGHRHMDPKKFEIKTERVTWNTRVFNVYPDRT